MLCHQMSLTMKRSYSRCCCPQRRQFTNILMLSIIWTMLFTETMARPNLETLLSNKPTNDVQHQQLPIQPDLYLDAIMTNTNKDKLFNKLHKYHHNQPNYMNKWPGLRDLVSTMNYDDNTGLEESNEFFNTKFFERLRQLVSTKSEAYDEDIRDGIAETNLMPLKSLKSSASMSANQLTFKDHNIKKNVQYMSPCHFKICNMGRKRDARFFANY